MSDLVRVLRGQRIDGRGTDEIMRLAADEIASLRSRLAEAEHLILRMAGEDYQRARFYVEKYDLTGERAADSASAVQSERCCLDYPRCDCNSPPEPDNAPTLQPCGHPWKAQHDFKCILCSSPGTALVKANE